MKTSLFVLYNNLKRTFAEEIKQEVKKLGGNVVVNREIPIFVGAVPTETKNLNSIKTVKEDGMDTYLVDCFYTDIDTQETEEVWEPLQDLPMDELYEIAEIFE